MCEKFGRVVHVKGKKQQVVETDLEDETGLEEQEWVSPYVSNGSPSRRAWERRVYKGEPVEEPEPEEEPVVQRRRP